MTLVSVPAVLQWIGAISAIGLIGGLVWLLFLPALFQEARVRFWRGRLEADEARHLYREREQRPKRATRRDPAQAHEPSPSTSLTRATGSGGRGHRRPA